MLISRVNGGYRKVNGSNKENKKNKKNSIKIRKEKQVDREQQVTTILFSRSRSTGSFIAIVSL